MTRVSVGFVKQLCDKHLNKERIEVLRIPNKIKAGKYKSKPIETFTLNRGHELSLLAKCGFLKKHYEALTEEAIRRGFNPTDYSDAFEGIPEHLMNDYEPTEHDRQIVRERITERLKTMKNLKFWRQPITVEEAIDKLKN
jgi:Pyrimidine dimer DNA glycosylase